MRTISAMTDIELRMLVADSVKSAMAAQADQYVTGKELCKQLQMFTPELLKKYGESLPRIKASILSKELGISIYETRYAYNISQIRKMIDENRLEFIFKPKVAYRASKCGKTTK